MDITLHVPTEFSHLDQENLEQVLNENVEAILFEYDLIRDFTEAKKAPGERFHTV